MGNVTRMRKDEDAEEAGDDGDGAAAVRDQSIIMGGSAGPRAQIKSAAIEAAHILRVYTEFQCGVITTPYRQVCN